MTTLRAISRSNSNRLFTSLGLLACGLFVVCGASRATADEAGPMNVFRHSDGATYFSLSLTPDVQPTAGAPREVVVLFDTSASQTSMYRDAALASLDALLESLSPSDQVRIAAVDLDARPMSDRSSRPHSPQTKEAVEKLRQEIPLGTTDLVRSMDAALDMFDDGRDLPRVVLYIGDGMSNANLLSGRPFQRMIERLREAQVSVSSFAIGPERDNQVLAVLANQTGGNLYVDAPMIWGDEAAGISVERATEENERRAAQVGRVLGQWVRASVIWPESFETSQSVESILPKQMPPLRSDRDTVVLGRLDPEATDVEIKVSASGERGQLAMAWSRPAAQASDTHAYLAQLVEDAQPNGGVTLPTVGSQGLAEAGRVVTAGVDRLTGMAERAVSMGDTKSAAQIADAVLRRDPGNLRAQTVQRVVRSGAPLAAQPVAERRGTQAPPKQDDPQKLELVRTAQAEPLAPPPGEVLVGDTVVVGPTLIDSVMGEADYPPAGEVTDGLFLSGVDRRNRVFSQMLETQVRNTISEARDKMSVSPSEAIQQLKLAMQNVEGAPELLADVRASLVDRIETALREAARAATFKAELDRQREAAAASRRELELINRRLAQKEEREKQLMATFNSLMDQMRYDEALAVADIVEEVDPEGVTPVAAQLWAFHARSHYRNQQLIEEKSRAFIETLWQVELSAVPIPDEPPIVYPSAEAWEELTNRRKKYKAVDLKSQGEAELRISEALQGPLTSVGLDFPETPLEEVVEFLRDEYDIEIQIDTVALEELGIDPSDPIDVNLRNISLRSALRLMLRQLELTYIIEDEVLQITTQEAAETRLRVKVYPVGDLVIDKTPIAGGGGGGGFGGGGGGGFGGGGGGFGGGGGGFGGGGGAGGFGGGGGGQFSVPEAAEEQATPEQDLVLSKEPAPSEAQRPASPKRKAQIIKIDESVPALDFWNAYFSAGQRDADAVRHTVHHLVKRKQHEQAITLIESALRNGQPQPWMYEALGIAMQLSGRSPQQVERAVMSAVDFSSSPAQLMLIAQYLLSLDLDQRAIQVYQQVTKIDPNRDDAYLLAMRAAERVGDRDGIVWATERILSRAWPVEQQEIEKTALRIAKATIRDMEAEGLTDDLADYRRRLAEALSRDCLVQVSWTGSADIDIVVEEPGGEVCSLAQPRTASGGVNLGDRYATEHESSVGGFSEAYVCPKGFSGSYRVRVRRVWGEVTAGKVTVDVVTNYRTVKQKHERRQIDLGEEEAVVLFELAEGRREEPVEQQQLAQAIERQRAIGRAVLAQQLGSLADPEVTPDRPEQRLRRQNLGRNGGAVGFQPVIQTLPDGTTYTVNAVASADRRYVIVRPSPQFSTIGNVSTFTFAGASNQDDQDDDDEEADGGGNNNGNFNFPGPQNGGGNANDDDANG